jgi:SAM-dependent methyltransferase
VRDQLPVIASRTVLDALRTLFDDAGYRENRICDLLGVQPPAAAHSTDPALLRRRTADGSPLSALMRLFLGGLQIARDELSDVLGTPGFDALSNAHLIASESDLWRATVRLVPAGPLVVACDRFERHRDGAVDFVVGPSPVSRNLADSTIRRAVDSTLDLGCGSGVLALLAATHSRRVVAADLNPRAVALTRFNAALNGLDHVEAVEGDLFEPVRGQRFDLIVSNPPFVISPGPRFLYRDGGSQICERIVCQAADYLSEDGSLQMLSNWPQYAGQDWRVGVGRWFDGCLCDAWVLRLHSLDAATYATAWLSQEFAGRPIPDESESAWLKHLARLGIESVGAGLVVMHRPRNRKPWLEVRDAPPVIGPAGECIARTLAARDLVARAESDHELLAARLMPSPDLEYRARQRPSGSGWNPVRSELKLSRGLSFAVRADPVAVAIIGLLDGKRSVREAAEVFAGYHGVSPQSFLAELPAAVRHLLSLGCIIPAGG